MPRQHPREAVLAKTRERTNLLVPREPANLAARIEVAVVTPRMITGEKKLVSIEQGRAAAGMPGNRDQQKVGRERHRRSPGENALDVSRRAGDVIRVHHPLAAE